MAALLWLLIPVLAGVFASVWGGWAARRRTAVPDAVGVAGYERFCAAMARTHGEGERAASAPPPPVPLHGGSAAPAAEAPGQEAA